MSDNGFIPFGPHEMRADGNLLIVRAQGTLTLDHMKELLAAHTRVKREHGSLFVLYDGQHATGIEPGARKYAAEQPAAEIASNATAAFGMSFTLRIMVNMIGRAYQALGREGVNLRVFETEAEARAYLDTERSRLKT